MPKSPIEQYVESFNVAGMSVRTQNKDEFNPETANLPALWQKFASSELASNSKIFGVYSNYDSDANGFYTVTAGVEISEPQGKFSEIKVEEGNYLVFEGTGPMPAALIETWKRVWEFFATETKYQRKYLTDFEAYRGIDQVAVYIGI